MAWPVLQVLRGDREGTFAMAVSGNRRLTFRFEYGTTGDVLAIDFEHYREDETQRR